MFHAQLRTEVYANGQVGLTNPLIEREIVRSGSNSCPFTLVSSYRRTALRAMMQQRFFTNCRYCSKSRFVGSSGLCILSPSVVRTVGPTTSNFALLSPYPTHAAARRRIFQSRPAPHRAQHYIFASQLCLYRTILHVIEGNGGRVLVYPHP